MEAPKNTPNEVHIVVDLMAHNKNNNNNNNIPANNQNQKTTPVVQSSKSSPSLSSIGIGSEKSDKSPRSPTAKSVRKWTKSPYLSGMSILPNKSNELPKLLPEGAQGWTDAVYDCIVYLIYCPQHDRIAVTNVKKLNCVWLPFVVLNEGITWKKASHQGVSMLIGRQDPEEDAEEAAKSTPEYTMSYLHILRLQLPSSKVVMRLTQFVQLEPKPEFVCCEESIRVQWVPSNDIIEDKVDKVWGPEMRMLTMMLLKYKPQIIDEFTLANTLYYWLKKGSSENEALMNRKLTESHIYAIYNDYVEHCYPSFYMCYESFRAYFIKNGLMKDNQQLKMMHQAFSYDYKHYIGFHEFLVGIVVIDPKTSNNLEARKRLIFRYYDQKKDHHLDQEDMKKLVKDIMGGSNDSLVNNWLKERNKISFEEFLALGPNFIEKLDKACRLPKSALEQIIKLEGKKSMTSKKDPSKLLKSNPKSSGTCPKCSAQEYCYGSHKVTIDTIGRCVEHKLLSKELLQLQSQMTSDLNSIKRKYSQEFVFSLNSIPSIFLDLVRDFYVKKDDSSLGLMSAPEDRVILVKYFRMICTELKQLLSQENKLIKTYAPCIVVGDIRGDLGSLFQVKVSCFQTFPIISENLIFLGNYTGENSYGMECLIYLFSMKLMTPNKVVLLRGYNEIPQQTDHILKRECLQKYGPKYGPILYQLVLKVFACLPIAVIVDETIACVHSGIPVIKNLEKLYQLPNEIMDLKRDAPIAYEIVSRYPEKCQDFDEMSSKGRQQPKQKSVDYFISRKLTTVKKSVQSEKSEKSDKNEKSNKVTGKTIAAKNIKSIGKKSRIKSIKSNKSFRMIEKSLKAKLVKSVPVSLIQNKDLASLNRSPVKVQPILKTSQQHHSKSGVKLSSINPRISGKGVKTGQAKNPAKRTASGSASLESLSSHKTKSLKYVGSLKESVLKRSSSLFLLKTSGGTGNSASSSSKSGGQTKKLGTQPGSAFKTKSFGINTAGGNVGCKNLPSYFEKYPGINNLKFGLLQKQKKLTFLLKTLRVDRKSIKFKNPKSKESTRSGKSISSKKSYSKKKKSCKTDLDGSSFRTPMCPKMLITATGKKILAGRNPLTFDQVELEDFLVANKLEFIIRSHSICLTNGFKTDFDNKCLTIFSSHYESGDDNCTNEQASIILIDPSNQSIRFIRFECD